MLRFARTCLPLAGCVCLLAACGGSTTTVTVTAPSGSPSPPSTAASPSGKVGSGHASGSYPTAAASGEIVSSSRMKIVVDATPPQGLTTVYWGYSCTQPGGGSGSTQGHFEMPLPGTHAVPLPASATHCFVNADAEIPNGTVTVTIFG